MASFLDKAGLTKFWENVKRYIDQNYIQKGSIYKEVKSELNQQFDNLYNDLNYLPIKDYDDITFEYVEEIKAYWAGSYNNYHYIRILLKFYNKTLLMSNIKDRGAKVKLRDILNYLLIGTNERYLGRLPLHEIYGNGIYSEVSFDIYLKRYLDGSNKYGLLLIPVLRNNSYTINFISGEQMIKYLYGNNKLLGSYYFYNVDLVTDSPFRMIPFRDPFLINDFIYRIITLTNSYDIEYTIRYPRYLNGLLTFLKLDITKSNTLILADKTPNVIDNTYNEVVLTKGDALLMYGDINIYFRDLPITEKIGLDISSTQDTTNKLLKLSGDISTIYGLLNTYYITRNKQVESLKDQNNFKLFHSPYIGNINLNNYNVPFDPFNTNIRLYKGLFNNTSITDAVAGIHITDRSYRMNTGDLRGIFNNYTEAYRNCKQLSNLRIYIYLEGDLNLDSTLEAYYIDSFWYSLKGMVDGSNKVNHIILLPGAGIRLNEVDSEKFSKLMKPIIDRIKIERPNWNVEIRNY